MDNKDNNKIVLVKYSLFLQPNGQLVSEVDHISPDEFLKASNEVDPEWEDAPVIAGVIKHVVGQLKVFDEDFEKYLASI